jgi:hypothetical protein
MRHEFILFPEARAKLESTGLTKRVEKARRDYTIGLTGMVSDFEIPGYVKGMQEDKLFETIPKEERLKFMDAMSEAFNEREKRKWVVQRQDGKFEESLDAEDFLLLTGWSASRVLKPEELWDYQRFGFSSITDLVGSVGTLIQEALSGRFRDGYKWDAQLPDGRIFANNISGTIHCDLSITQKDITPYPTIDPLGNPVSFRPRVEGDARYVSGYHSVEGALLASVIKYVDQRKIKSSALENLAETLDWVKSLGQHGGSCTEHFGGCEDNPKNFFISYDDPIPVLDSNNSTKEWTGDRVFVNSERSYGIYLSPDGQMVFAGEQVSKDMPSKKEVGVMYRPEEADHLVKGLLYQSAMGLGRTSAKQLIDILQYRFSEQFSIDQREFQEMSAKYRK